MRTFLGTRNKHLSSDNHNFSEQTLTLVLFILFMKMQANSLSPKWPEQRPVDCISFVPQLTEVLSIDLTWLKYIHLTNKEVVISD